MKAFGSLVLFCCLVAAAAFFPWGASPTATLANETIAIENAAGTVHVVDGVGKQERRQIYFYSDFTYPSGRGFGEAFAHGFSRHFAYELGSRHINADLRTIDATALRDVLQKPGNQSILVVLSGMLPSNVRDASSDLLRPWIKGGGEVFWAGGPFDAAYGFQKMLAKPVATDYSKWPEFYGPAADVRGGGLTRFADVYSPRLLHGFEETSGQRLLDIRFNLTTFRVEPNLLRSLYPTKLGFDDLDGNSSVTRLKFGRGSITVFGDACADDVQCALDIAQIVWLSDSETALPTSSVLSTGKRGTAVLRGRAWLNPKVFVDVGDQYPVAIGVTP